MGQSDPEDWEVRLVSALLNELIAQGRFSWEEKSDLTQAIFKKWRADRTGYASLPLKARKASLRKTVRSVVEDKYRHDHAKKRQVEREAIRPGPDAMSLMRAPSVDDASRLALADVISSLTPRQREIWLMRSEEISVTAIARTLGVDRNVVRREIETIRQACIEAGIRP